MNGAVNVARFSAIFAMLALAGGIYCPARADGLGVPFTQIKHWILRKSKDAMTDKVSCLATLAENSSIQLSSDSLDVVAPGAEAYNLRMDVDPAQGMNLMSDIEKRAGVIEVRDYILARIVRAQRLRIELLTYSGTQNLDLNIEGADGAMVMLQSKTCLT